MVVRAALEATADDVLAADGYLLGTTANFGYMSGALKHFFDTIFLEAGGALTDDGSAGSSAGREEALRPVGARPLRHDGRGAVGADDRRRPALAAVGRGPRAPRRPDRRRSWRRRTSWAGRWPRWSPADYVVRGTSRRAARSSNDMPEGLGHGDAVGADPEDREVGVDPVDAAHPGQRVGARGHQLGRAVLGEQRHHHEHLLGADGEVHRAADGRDRVRGAGVPVGQVAAPPRPGTRRARRRRGGRRASSRTSRRGGSTTPRAAR